MQYALQPLCSRLYATNFRPYAIANGFNLSSIRRSAQFKNDIHNRWRTYVFKKSIKNVVKLLLKYAFDRGIYVQMNSNLTLSLDRYLEIAEYIDVMHISHNWGRID